MKKFVFYTAAFGNLGKSRRPELTAPDTDRFFYTDLDINDDFYQMRRIDLDYLSPVMRQRFVKTCIPDEIFDNYEHSLYIDRKHPIKIDFDYYLSCLEPGSDFVTRLHRYKRRTCVYEEGKVCIEKGKGNEADILRQLEFYRKENYPVNNGLYATFIVFRRHTEKLKEFSRLWWEQLKQYSFRDQISLPYLAWKHNVKISICKRVR